MRGAPAILAGLPNPASSFVGRGADLRTVAALFARSRLLTLVGPGGSGKTRLVLEAVRRLRPRRRVFFVDLTAVGEGQSADDAVAAAISGHGPGGGDSRRVLLDLLGGDSVLILDNCEHVVEECAATVARLLAATSDLRVLATSREALGLSGETTYQVPPLGPADSTRLFIDRAQARVPTWMPSAEAMDAIARICAALDGMPLAIELAAGKAGMLTPEQLLPLLDDRFGILTGGPRDQPARHRTLRAAVDWTYQLLDREERALYRRLSVFSGFDIAAAIAAGGPGAIDRLGGLVAKSVVALDPASGTRPRYRMPVTLREYGLQALEADGEAGIARALHLEHFSALAEATFAGAQVASAAQLIALGDDLDNVRAALVWSLEEDPARGLSLAGAARDLWFLRAQGEGYRLCSSLLDSRAGTLAQRARALVTAAQLANALQLTDRAVVLLEEAMEISARAGLVEEHAWAAYARGVGAFLGRDPATARLWLERSREEFDGLGIAIGIERATGSLGTLAFLVGDRVEAARALGDALSQAREIGDAWGEGLCHTYLALADQEGGHGRAAEDHLRAAARLLRSVGDTTILTLAIAGLATAGHHGDRRRAVRVAAAATAIRERIGGSFAPLVAERVQHFIEESRRVVGKEAVEREIGIGRRMSLEETVRLALGEGAVGTRPGPAGSGLSPREAEVARLVATGLSNLATAKRLGLSERTVENHVFRATSKLGLENRTQLATWAVENLS